MAIERRELARRPEGPRLVGYLQARCQSEIRLMEFADYAFLGAHSVSYGIELKTVQEFLASFKSGRLEEQLLGCLESFVQVVVLLQGAVSFERSRRGVRIDVEEFRRLQSVVYGCEEHGIVVVGSSGWLETAETILGLYNNRQEEVHTFLQRIKPKRPLQARSRDEHSRRVGLVMMSLGVGEVTAESLLRAFNDDPWAVITATPQRLMLVPGVGGTTVEKIWERWGRGNPWE